MKELSYLNKYLLKYKFRLLLGLLFIIISNVFAIIPAQIVRRSINLVEENIALFKVYEGLELQDLIYDIFAGSILVYGIAILVLALLKGFFTFLTRQTVIVVSRFIEFDLKNEVYEHYQSLPTSFYRRNNTGDLMARISEDVSKVRMYLGPGIMYGLNLFTLFAILIPYMFSVNVRLTLYTLIPLPILSLSIYYVNNIINRRSEEIQRSLSELSTYVQEAFSGIRVIKSFVREEDSANTFINASNDYKDKSIKLTFVNALFIPLIVALIGLSSVITVFIGGAEVIKGAISPGVIAEFIIYVNMLTWPVTSLGWITSIIQRAAASQKRINEFLHTKNDILSGEVEKEIKGDVALKNVSFVYPDSGIKALKNISFDVKAGQSIAIVGTTGSGKSTIANVIPRMYDIHEGAITIDGVNIKNYDLHTLRSQIGYVPQDVFLFSDTIYNNITFGSVGITEQQVEEAAYNADLKNTIEDFPGGFGTKLGERGITLSGGQKQRVSIARAIARDPKILVLDDCLSAVDTKTENTILTSLKDIMQGRTTIIISHRVSSAKLADKIVVLDDGEIVEEGTNESLLSRDGFYKNLYDKQMQADEAEKKARSLS
ncbi:ATP-binding cassette subfamily B multidrug efflux pump [Catalinimonas alkaloidigena]|uniref:ABC transporter ATP-binding protein n=1 Tax=Catalinimonas alkaloidigena TaxID=1075417 RepID=UPI0024066797|nr:ABC transporter ATP-binding protein [Catalinimonas alkaloidigena]MDF9801023.1 ATP-binding cassette subfamily B multidrug efflux pump [Catalinimonas alkaloidigena]